MIVVRFLDAKLLKFGQTTAPDALAFTCMLMAELQSDAFLDWNKLSGFFN